MDKLGSTNLAALVTPLMDSLEITKFYHSPFLFRIKHAHFGDAVFVQCCGRTDSKGFSLSSTKKEFYNYCIWMLESYVKATKVETERTGKLVTQTSYIFDYEGFSMREIANKSNLDMALNVTRFLFLHYPDSSRRLFIINGSFKNQILR
ncbi:hypothetical protein DAPPUDRAFT_314245 [Daphnia pulex]|uniref:CRAL-TRIO domain-containing protein n=1 Tax=Daphnia pulex TaxID=6669 RepID=E9G527_DAPPU|nr:hypothetical protein DAPPUDRAFT_314245 [Daphnia pulex]|eukprot:EFX85399.1 hypothetical protein DAPPUDRAFT_314245 [Daphnia pulex]